MADDDAERIFRHVGDMCISRVKAYIDALYPAGASPDSDRYAACVQAGKSLMILGASFIGQGLGVRDPERGLFPVKELLDRLKADVCRLAAQIAADEELRKRGL